MNALPESVVKLPRKARRMMTEVLPGQDEGGAFCDERQQRWLKDIRPQRDALLSSGRVRTGAAIGFGMTWLNGYRQPPRLNPQQLVLRADMLDVLLMTDRPYGRRGGQLSRLVLGHNPRVVDRELVIGGGHPFVMADFFRMPQSPGQVLRLRLLQSGKLVNSWRNGRLYVRGLTDFVDLCVGLDDKERAPVIIYRFHRRDVSGDNPGVIISGFESHEIPASGEIVESEMVTIGEVVAEARRTVEISTCEFNKQGRPKFLTVDRFSISRRRQREIRALLSMDACLNSGNYQVEALRGVRCMVQFPVSLLGSMVASLSQAGHEFEMSKVMAEHLQEAMGPGGLRQPDGSRYSLQLVGANSGRIASIDRGDTEVRVVLSSGAVELLPPTAVLHRAGQALNVGDVVAAGDSLGDWFPRDPAPSLGKVWEAIPQHFAEMVDQFLLDQTKIDTTVAPGALLYHQYASGLLPLASRAITDPQDGYGPGQPLWYVDLSSLAGCFDEDSGYLVAAIESLDFPVESFVVDGMRFIFSGE